MLQKGRDVTKRIGLCYKKDRVLQKGIRHVTKRNTDVTKRNTDVTKRSRVCYQKDTMLQKGILHSFL